MKRQHFAVSAAALAAMICPLSAGITFGPVKAQPGESVRLVTHSETPGGTIQKTTAGRTGNGTITVIRDRDLIWTFRAPAADGMRRGMVRVARLSSYTKVKLDGKEEKTNDDSPLTGRMFAMSKTTTGDWKFELDGSLPLTRVHNDIDELTVYLKRDWYPASEINLGDSWEFDPSWVKMIVEKDLSKAQTIGTMRLRQVRRGEKRQTAVIDITIHSTGGDYKSDGSQSSASIELTGQVTVNLSTMLDESLELNGTITTSSSKPGENTKVKLPVHLTATKSFVHDSGMP